MPAAHESTESYSERRNLVVMGASAGGVETLREVVSRLPADLPAAVCVVLHVAPESPSALASILRRSGPLPCRTAADGDELREGEILVAPPDRHLIVRDGHVALTPGPRENGHRPSVDVLFRSAADVGDGRVVGVVLSGTRDDGSAGLALIKQAGGAAIVQDPEEAIYGAMPANALRHVYPDAVVPAREVAAAIVRLVSGWTSIAGGASPGDELTSGTSITSVCPECGGVLSEQPVAGVAQWACKVGHRYSAESLADAQAGNVEAAMWVAVRALEDRHALLDRMASDAEIRGGHRAAMAFRQRARQAASQAGLVREGLRQAAGATLRPIADAEAEHR